MTSTLVRGAAAALLALAAAIAPAAMAPAAAASVGEAPVAAVPAGVDDFTFDSFSAVYELGRDADGRSVLETTETLVARFPEYDQNRGIRRAIPLHYDGHPVDLSVQSVTDATGAPRAYETDTDDDDEFLLVTVAGDAYVHGVQTYVITYRQHNVTLQPDDAAIDEFYWDVNGTGWAQPFGTVRAELRVDEALADAFTGDAACYRGWSGSSTPCETLQAGSPPDPLLVARADALGPYENLTIAVAFEPGTFVPRDESFGASPAAVASAVAAAVAFAVFLLALVLRLTAWRNAPRGTIIAQYEPPAGVSALLAAELVGQSSRGVTATILERAVAGEVRILDRGGKKYSVRFEGGPLGDLDAQSVVRALFGDYPSVGQERSLSSKSATLGQRLILIRKAVAKGAADGGLRRRPAIGARIALAAVAIGAAVVAFIGAVLALESVMGGGWPFLTLFAGGLSAFATVVVVADVRPLTAEGRRIRDHLEGLRLFIRLAEADRIRMLQSPSGALRDPLRTGAAGVAGAAGAGGAPGPAAAGPDAAEVLRLTERLLPYAALFGLERQWLREMAHLYEVTGREPGWYAGASAFDAARFAVAVASFTTVSTTSWSGSSSSSSSSGSGGGGSSGGGGGGGGGGGV